MSVTGKNAGAASGWRRFLNMVRWRKGKDERDSVLDGKVVLTKVKSLTDSSETTASQDERRARASAATASRHDAVEVPLDDGSCQKDEGPLQVDCSSTHLATVVLSATQPTEDKAESDSGVELPSGANSSTTRSNSEQSFHSLESSCRSSDVSSRLPTPDPGPCEENPSHPLLSSADPVQVDEDEPSEDSGIPSQDDLDTREVTEDEPGSEGSGISDSLEEYMDQCCRISETQQLSRSTQGSGVVHIFQQLEKIGRLQAKLQLEREMAARKEEFFRQRCKCGAAALAYKDPGRPGPGPGPGPDPAPRRDFSCHRALFRTDSSPPSDSHCDSDDEEIFVMDSLVSHQRSDKKTWSMCEEPARPLWTTSAALKTSCPQLYRFDPQLDEVGGWRKNRNSMNNQDDFTWL